MLLEHCNCLLSNTGCCTNTAPSRPYLLDCIYYISLQVKLPLKAPGAQARPGYE